MRRIIKGIQRGRPATFFLDDVVVDAFEGESVAAALFAAGVTHFRDAPEDGSARGPFCFMGVCQECVVSVDGSRVESCRLSVSDGLRVSRLS